MIDKGDDNARIAKHLGISKKMGDLLYKHLNPNALHELDYKIQNVNDLANDDSKQPTVRRHLVHICFQLGNGFSYLSDCDFLH